MPRHGRPRFEVVEMIGSQADHNTPSLMFSDPISTSLAHSDLELVVTGAGGWIGQATIEMLESSLGPSFSQRVHLFASYPRTMTLRSGTSVQCQSLDQLHSTTVGSHLLVHLAYVTKEFVAERGPLAFIDANAHISATIQAHVQNTDVVGLFFPSSGAVYGTDGEIDDDLASNPYGALKFRDEQRFRALLSSPQRAAVIRLFNLSGPFLTKSDRFVLGSILKDLASGRIVNLMADRPVIRSYIHVQDLVELAFAIMLGHVDGPNQSFDTAGEREIEVGELALLAAAVLGKGAIEIERPPMASDGSPDRYVGDGAVQRSLAAQLGQQFFGLEDQIKDTATFLNIPVS
jgi:UDP-glucuronate decarboxylase